MTRASCPDLVRRVAVIVLALAVVGVSPAPVAAEALTVGVASVAAGQGGLLLAKRVGFFKDQGLDVELALFGSSTEGMQALVSGQIPVAVVGGSAVVNAALAGADVVLIGALLNTVPHVLVVGPEIATAAALRGRTIGINRFGTSSDFATRFALRRLGLDPERDVTFLQLGQSSIRLAALQARGIHATLLEPSVLVASRKLGFRELLDLSRLHLVYPAEALVTSKAFVREHPDVLRKLLRGLVVGVHAFKARRDDAIATLRAYLKNDDPETLAITYDLYARAIEAKLYAPPEGIQTVLDELAGRNPRARTATPADFLDMRFVKELDDSGFIGRLYR